MSFYFRPIQPEDNPAIFHIIKQVVIEHGCDQSDYITDAAQIQDLASEFVSPDSRYWVIVLEASGQVVGGGGFARLPGTSLDDKTCELQKLYFLPEARGHGLAHRMMDMILSEAEAQGYETIYLECVPQLAKAIKLYESYQFQHIPNALGHTGHSCCSIFMSRPLHLESLEQRTPIEPSCCPTTE